MPQKTILVIEDDRSTAVTLTRWLTAENYIVKTSSDSETALKALKTTDVDLCFLDYILPGRNGLSLLEDMKDLNLRPPVIFMTAHSTVDTAVRAMKAGASDYITKPLNQDTVLLKARSTLEINALRDRMENMQSSLQQRHAFTNLIAESPAMKQALNVVKTVGRSATETIMLLGESGVGKTMIAQTIHYNSPRADEPFTTVLCSALPANLLESELFGHEKGAFTDAKEARKGLLSISDGGTVFMDEIGEMPLVLQAKLLQFLENRSFRRVGGSRELSVDVRVVAATNQDLATAVKEGRFRADLYYRLNVIEIKLPALRDRRADICPLAEKFIATFNEKFGKRVSGLTDDARHLLESCPWYGNVRELRNVLERAMILTNNERLRPSDFPGLDTATQSEGVGNIESLPPESLNLIEHEKALIRRALDLTNGNQTHAADLLGITRNTLLYRMRKFKLHTPAFA